MTLEGPERFNMLEMVWYSVPIQRSEPWQRQGRGDAIATVNSSFSNSKPYIQPSRPCRTKSSGSLSL